MQPFRIKKAKSQILVFYLAAFVAIARFFELPRPTVSSRQIYLFKRYWTKTWGANWSVIYSWTRRDNKWSLGVVWRCFFVLFLCFCIFCTFIPPPPCPMWTPVASSRNPSVWPLPSPPPPVVFISWTAPCCPYWTLAFDSRNANSLSSLMSLFLSSFSGPPRWPLIFWKYLSLPESPFVCLPSQPAMASPLAGVSLQVFVGFLVPPCLFFTPPHFFPLSCYCYFFYCQTYCCGVGDCLVLFIALSLFYCCLDPHLWKMLPLYRGNYSFVSFSSGPSTLSFPFPRQFCLPQIWLRSWPPQNFFFHHPLVRFGFP